jgi:hypothetical protein
MEKLSVRVIGVIFIVASIRLSPDSIGKDQ